ncbi:MAG TPA: nitroreductase family deazaflavin-dependent oxidoreductase [Ktedonobacteraceae bacterium]
MIAKWLIKLNNWINREVVWRVYRLFSGGSMARHFLLLLTRGRKTGNVRTVMITYLRENATFLVVASNGGQTRIPAWYHNLRAHPQAEIQVGKQRFQVDAEIVPPDEHERLWAAWLKQYPAYENAQKKTTRRFPLVRLISREKRANIFG